MGAKATAEEFKGGDADRGGGDGLRARKEGGQAGLAEGRNGGDAADSFLEGGAGDSLVAGAGAGAGAGAELRRGARTTTTVKATPPRLRPRVTEVPAGPGTRAFTESHVGVGVPSTERRRST